MNFTHLLLALLSIARSTATPLSNNPSLDITAHKASKTPDSINFSTSNHHASPSWPLRSTLALTNLTLPIDQTANTFSAPTPLPFPTNTTHLLHIALGRGIQNYTCLSPSNSSAIPVSAGALAVLYNITALLAHISHTSHNTPAAAQVLDASLVSYALSLPKSEYPGADGGGDGGNTSARLTALNLEVSGFHFFAPSPATSNVSSVAAAPIPHFDLTHVNLGAGAAVKMGSSNAPVRAGLSVFSTNSSTPSTIASPATFSSSNSTNSTIPPAYAPAAVDVPWLYLEAANGTDSIWKSVYRVKTQGGVAPATCAGLEGREFGVEYAAEYWFYG